MSSTSAPRARTALAARVGGLPRTFWVLWGGTLVNRLGTFVEPFLILYLTTQRGLSLAAAGAVVALYGVGSLAGPVLGGSLADLLGRRATLAGALLGSAALLAGLGAARATWLIALLALLLGAAGDAYRPAVQAAVADVVAFADRRRAAGLIFWAVNLGFAIAAVAGGALASAGYTWLFAIDAATCVAYALVVLRLVPETRPDAGTAPGPGDAEGEGGWLSILRDRTIVAELVVLLCGALALVQLFTTLPLAMEADGLGPAAFGAVLAVNGVVIVVLYPVVATAVLRREPCQVIAASSALFAAGLLVLGSASSLPVYVVGLVVMTCGEVLVSAVGPGLVQELAPRHMRGRYAGAYGLCFSVAYALVPLVATQLLGDGGSLAPWVLGAALAGLAGLAQLALRGRIGVRRTLAEAREARLDADALPA